ncbi:MAG: hypothetical protein IJ952_03270, partial [Alistipes sp.]|nr:hypothetical protein [Alistipes sp.]
MHYKIRIEISFKFTGYFKDKIFLMQAGGAPNQRKNQYCRDCRNIPAPVKQIRQKYTGKNPPQKEK